MVDGRRRKKDLTRTWYTGVKFTEAGPTVPWHVPFSPILCWEGMATLAHAIRTTGSTSYKYRSPTKESVRPAGTILELQANNITANYLLTLAGGGSRERRPSNAVVTVLYTTKYGYTILAMCELPAIA